MDLLFIFQCTLLVQNFIYIKTIIFCISTLLIYRVMLITEENLQKNSNIWAHSSDG